MNIQTLAESAGKRINDGLEDIVLVLPWSKSKRHRYLAGSKSSKGEIVGGSIEGHVVAFNAIDVLAFCVANGAKINVAYNN